MAKFYFYYSAMNAGKSATLIQSYHNYVERGMEVEVFTFCQIRSDDLSNDDITRVKSRTGISVVAKLFDNETDLYGLLKNSKANCIMIDEAQFLSEKQVWDLALIVDKHSIPVLTFGLRTDFKGVPFEGSKQLLAICDTLTEIKTICHCGRKATMNVRVDALGNIVKEGDQIEVGGNDKYISLCRLHFTSR